MPRLRSCKMTEECELVESGVGEHHVDRPDPRLAHGATPTTSVPAGAKLR